MINLKRLIKQFQPTLSLEQARLPYKNLPIEIQELTTLFGSRAYGGAKQYSDVDLLINTNDLPRLEALLTSKRIAYTSNHAGYLNNSSTLKFTWGSNNYEITAPRYNSTENILAAKYISLYANHVAPITNSKSRKDEHKAVLSDIKNNLMSSMYIDLAKRYSPELLL